VGLAAVAKLGAQFRQHSSRTRHDFAVHLHPLDFDEQISS